VKGYKEDGKDVPAYTTFAGLLNLLVVYDAWAGPMRPAAAANGGKTPAGGEGKPRR